MCCLGLFAPARIPLVFSAENVSHSQWQRKRVGNRTGTRLRRIWYVQSRLTTICYNSLIARDEAGVAELLVFHPVDTIAKRLMSNKSSVRVLLR